MTSCTFDIDLGFETMNLLPMVLQARVPLFIIGIFMAGILALDVDKVFSAWEMTVAVVSKPGQMCSYGDDDVFG